MIGKYQKTVAAIYNNPINGNIECCKIEALFITLGCRVVEGKGSSVTFEKNGIRAYFHRPHPSKEALRYRIKATRDFLTKLGVTP